MSLQTVIFSTESSNLIKQIIFPYHLIQCVIRLGSQKSKTNQIFGSVSKREIPVTKMRRLTYTSIHSIETTYEETEDCQHLDTYGEEPVTHPEIIMVK